MLHYIGDWHTTNSEYTKRISLPSSAFTLSSKWRISKSNTVPDMSFLKINLLNNFIENFAVKLFFLICIIYKKQTSVFRLHEVIKIVIKHSFSAHILQLFKELQGMIFKVRLVLIWKV